ncbi:MAG TPA: response regulator [Candidatus Krumholzibacteria bacterium]|nr:response regulator [Candidatus Krumholzibacteria bacterium]HPD70258.1 response regulator [Candidatus Krumholzibacteria bacterium]HRY40042.1 response regulator [Candidatus Krumholzibacteria bacterium]
MTNQAKILVIDDDPDIHEICRLVLEPQGYAVAVASSGADGRAAMAADPADLVVLDVMMEEADAGFQTAQWLAEKFPAVPVLMLSSIADAADSLFDTGTLKLADLVNKPIAPRALVETVRRLLAARP